MNIAICDDVTNDREKTAKQLNNYFVNPTVSEFTNGEELLSAHETRQFDLIFLDILMPGINGIETAEKIRVFDEKTPIVFITSSEEFAVQSYRVFAFDYFIKPVSQEAMNCCLSRFTKLIPDIRYINVEYMSIRTNVLLKNIMYLESQLRKVIFHLVDGEDIVLTGKMEDFLELTMELDFCRCHKSFIVNLNYVDSLHGEDFYLSNGNLLRISRSFSNEAKKAYFDYIFGKSGLCNE